MHHTKALAFTILRLSNRFRRQLFRPRVVSIFDSPVLQQVVSILPSSGTIVHSSRLATPETLTWSFSSKEAYVLHDVLVWTRHGIVGQPDGAILAETGRTAYQLEHLLNRVAFRKTNPLMIDVPSVSIERDAFWTNYYHSLIDDLPRLYALHHEPFVNMDRVLLLLPRSPKPFERAVMEAILPANVQTMIVPSDRNCVHAKWYAFLPFMNDGYGGASLPLEYLSWFRQRVLGALDLGASVKADKRVYISRAKAPKRHFTNELELMACLKRLGFEAFCLEDLAFVDQVDVFRRASIVVARHGAGLTNILFARNCHVLEIASPDVGRNYYRALSAALRLPYANVVLDGTRRDDFVAAPLSDVEEKIMQMLEHRGAYAETHIRHESGVGCGKRGALPACGAVLTKGGVLTADVDAKSASGRQPRA